MNTLDYVLEKCKIVPGEPVGDLIEIPNSSRYDLAKWLRELDFKTGVEVGVAAGNYSRVLCELNQQMQIWGVDSWQAYGEYDDFSQEDLDRFYAEVVRQFHIYRKRYRIMRKFSSDALADFEDGSLDFVYLDANHDEPYIAQDLTNWSKKVRSGGIVAGHDYIKRSKFPWPVKDAVDRFVNENRIHPLIILGKKETLPGMVREDIRSWMWVKQ